MPKVKGKKKKSPDPGKTNPQVPERGALSEDQRERGYYYDDSHGYKTYRPDSETTIDEEEKDG